jgi:hypothetical protein
MPMTRGKIERAREAALQFVAHCELMLIRLDEDLGRPRYDSDKREWVAGDIPPSPSDHSWGSKESGALRRKSMDLTRTLADLRKSDF